MPLETTNAHRRSSFSSRFREDEDDSYSPLPTRPGSPICNLGTSLQHLHIQPPQRPLTPGPSRTRSSPVRVTCIPLCHPHTPRPSPLSHPFPIVQNPHPLLPDWWHQPSPDGRPRRVGGSGDFWAGDNVAFYPDPQYMGTGQQGLEGVSMELALQGCAQMLLGDQTLEGRLPFARIRGPILRVQWPGYQEFDPTYSQLQPLRLDRPLLLTPTMTFRKLAQQLAQLYFEFAMDETYANSVSAPPYPRGLIPLGAAQAPNTVNFNWLRMVKLWYNVDERVWNLEVIIVDDYMGDLGL
ncbi:hypothetical protein FB45DRAFT_1059912 [Roridomyces roridus]|uniref:Uncharacterized protein n=1 Tax=Roridomyces roridus TaxID=1738132 RepID=A0AAD7FLM0_9AGAR|nr:hypothetical protein FB45DRAFT_1059912 [Roridomyces roridus]